MHRQPPLRPVPRIAEISLAICSLLAIAGPAADAGQSPYPPSPVIAGFHVDGSTHERHAPGSDNWPVTWADDDHQYAAWGDGGGFGGTNRDGRVSLGFARVEGPHTSYRGFNVWGGKDPEHPARFPGKSYGIVCIEGVLYAWVGQSNYDQTRLYRSTDHAASWTAAPWQFRRSDGLIWPTILNFGKDYAGARDGYVYHYFIQLQDDATRLQVHKPGLVCLARAAKDRLFEESAWEWFAGRNGGEALWSPHPAAKQPVFNDPNGVGWCLSVSHNAGLRRYLLCTEHDVTYQGHLGVFDAPQPWGPWTTVAYETNWLGSEAFFWNFANKWLSADGRDFTLVFTGINQFDSWNTVRGTFALAGPDVGTPAAQPPAAAPYGPSPVISGIDWAPADSIVRTAKDGDNWPLTWADDDALYTTWGDGTGFPPKVERKLSCGFARVTGPPDDFTGLNIRSDAEQLGEGRKGKKGWGLLSVGGTLYVWFGHADQNGAAAQLAWSDDHARTWTFADWQFAEFGLIGFVNYGRDYDGARDEFVYCYSHDGPRADTPADRFVLFRAPRDRLTERDAWEFFEKTDADGRPVWTSDVTRRGAVFTHADACLRSAMTYNAGLKRYVWWQQIPQPPGHRDRGDTRFEGGFGIYDAPEPWGPWTTASFTPRWDVGPGEHADFPSKWISDDGRTMHLVFSGEDSFSVRRASVRQRAEAATP